MKRAIDLAFIPPKEICDIAIELSNSVSRSKLKLNMFNQIPHVSLLLGGIEVSRIENLWRMACKVMEKFKSLHVSLIGLKSLPGFSSLVVEKSPILLSIQDELVTNLSSLVSYSNTSQVFADPSQTDEISVEWLNMFPQNSTGQNYSPHITVSDESLQKPVIFDFPIPFTLTRFALCYVGNLCTCSSIIDEINLK